MQLTPEQQAAVTRLYEHDNTLMIAPLGFGKAVVALTALQELVLSGTLKRVLVMAPLRVITSTWMTEITKWSHLKPELFACAVGDLKARAPVTLVNFESAHHVLDNSFDGLLIDELTRMKTSGGVLFRAMRGWVKKLKWRAGMTATPVAEHSADLYGQCLLLDDGRALGKRKESFLQEYFYKINDYELLMRPGAADAIARKMKDLLYVADGSSYIASLPPLYDEALWLPLTAEADDLYQTMREDSIVWVDEQCVVAGSAGVRAMKLGQIAAGGLYAGEESRLVWRCETRRARVMHEIAQIEEPTVIVYNYAFELDMLEGIPVLGGNGTATSKDIERFNRGELLCIAGHPKSMGQGLNLQGACCRMLVLSPILSGDLNQQVIGRIHRRGQNRACTRYTILSEDTIHESWADALAGKRTNEEQMMRALAP